MCLMMQCIGLNNSIYHRYLFKKEMDLKGHFENGDFTGFKTRVLS